MTTSADNLLHGITLEMMVTRLVEFHGWEEMGRIIPVRCFLFDPTVTSSLKFLRKTPWARKKVEDLYLRSPGAWPHLSAPVAAGERSPTVTSTSLPTEPPFPAMSTSPVKAIPDGMTAVTPHLIVDGAEAAIEFYKKAFNAEGGGVMHGPNGKVMHAQITIGGAHIMLVDEMPEWKCLGPKALGGSSVTIHLYVEDADTIYAQAVAAGATPTMPLEDQFWGDRYGKVRDPFGHDWSIATHIRDATLEEMQDAMKSMGDGGEGCGGSK